MTDEIKAHVIYKIEPNSMLALIGGRVMLIQPTKPPAWVTEKGLEYITVPDAPQQR